MHTLVGLDAVRAFRAGIYRALGRRRDTLFALLDAASRGGAADSLPHLSLVAGHRRGHGSVYAALREGTVDGSALRAALAGQPLGHGQAAYAMDVSVAARCDAETSPGRTYYHHASRPSAGQPIVAGWAYTWVAQLGRRSARPAGKGDPALSQPISVSAVERVDFGDACSTYEEEPVSAARSRRHPTEEESRCSPRCPPSLRPVPSPGSAPCPLRSVRCRARRR